MVVLLHLVVISCTSTLLEIFSSYSILYISTIKHTDTPLTSILVGFIIQLALIVFSIILLYRPSNRQIFLFYTPIYSIIATFCYLSAELIIVQRGFFVEISFFLFLIYCPIVTLGVYYYLYLYKKIKGDL